MRDVVLAHHEAAHGVIAIVCGIAVSRVSIVRSRDTLGYMRPAQRITEIGMDSVAITWLSGPAAEKRLTGAAGPGCAEDFTVARAFVAAMLRGTPTPARVDEHLARFAALAEARVCLHWDWITRVAEALMRRRGLTGSEIADLQT